MVRINKVNISIQNVPTLNVYIYFVMQVSTHRIVNYVKRSALAFDSIICRLQITRASDIIAQQNIGMCFIRKFDCCIIVVYNTANQSSIFFNFDA